jgi:hypothetical protein
MPACAQMNRRVISAGCGGCWAEVVEARPGSQVRQAARIPSGRDWPLLSLGVASLGHCSLRLLGDPFSLFLEFQPEFQPFQLEFQPFLTEFQLFLTDFNRF